MNKQKAEQLAQDNELEVIEVYAQVTSSCEPNYALIGFISKEQVEKFANDNELIYTKFFTRSVWGSKWKGNGFRNSEPTEITTALFGGYEDEDYAAWTRENAKEYLEWYVDFIGNEIENKRITSFDDIKRYTEHYENIYRMICNLADDEILITFEEAHFGTFKKLSMDYTTDTYRYAIGVI